MDTSPNAILERNLAALAIGSPRAAEMIRAAAARRDLEFVKTDEGTLSALLGSGVGARALASRRRPMEEARRLVEKVDLAAAAGIAVLGFGLGYHVRVLAERMRGAQLALADDVAVGLVLVYEPDAGLLRAVLERVDCSSWLGKGHVAILIDGEAPAISESLRGREALPFLGTSMAYIEHPEARVRIGEGWGRFRENLAAVLEAAHANVATTLVQVETTLRNLQMNLDLYATCPGVGSLRGQLRGRPAIVVSAGPSLRRNMALLARPGVRERFVIIAAQTVLKPLLAKGIRPHFVTALDYHEISRRFYEGLTAADVEGVTLVVEPKANPAIAQAFPGRTLIPGDPNLDQLLGEDLVKGLARRTVKQAAGGLTPEGETLTPGATVAHMAYYLARHLGCDPVILIGQDLGFTDGQYYSAGAAIHTVWSGELGGFNTLEMMEWQRIVRGRKHLHRTTDVMGRPIYTDVQMGTYLVQFERDFGADRQRGLTIVDATEGGVAKRGAEAMTLAAALERYWPADELSLKLPAEPQGGRSRLGRVKKRVEKIRRDIWKVADLSRRATGHLSEMLEHHSEQGRVNQLIGKVDELKNQAEKLEPALGMVMHLNQTGTLKRAREDRRLGLEESLTPMQRQKRQIERDIMNLRWLAEAADQLGSMLDDACRCLAGAPKITRDPVVEAAHDDEGEGPLPGGRGPERRRVAAMVAVDPDRCGLGTARALDEPFLCGENPLRLMLRRLARCRELDGVVLLCADPDRVRGLAGEPLPGLAVEFVKTDGPPMGGREEAIRGARLWARSSWRGGLSSMTVYDEACFPGAMAPVMAERGIDAAAVVGADWALVDPVLVDTAVARYRERSTGPGAHRLVFCQAPPGLGACVVERSLMRDLADRARSAGVFASIGGLLGYVPVAPMQDPIAKSLCIATEPLVRDAQYRFIPDSGPRRALLVRTLLPMGEHAVAVDAAHIAAMVGEQQRTGPAAAPQELVLELCTGRHTSGARGVWLRGGPEPVERPVMTLAMAGKLIGELCEQRSDAAITFGGAGDPLLHPELARMVALARRLGAGGVHIRTDLACDPERIESLLDIGADIISVDLMAESAAVYRAVMGADLFDRVRRNLEGLITARAARHELRGTGLPTPWIVPRLTRCDAVYGEIESFFDRWLMAAGAAVIDPLPGPLAGERIEPLPLPASAAWRMGRERMMVLSDGRVPMSEVDLSGDRVAGDAAREGLMEVWRRVSSRRHQAAVSLEGKPVAELLHGAGSRARVARLGEL